MIFLPDAARQPPAREARSECEALAVLHLYAASVAGHPGALMAMGYRHSQATGSHTRLARACIVELDSIRIRLAHFSRGPLVYWHRLFCGRGLVWGPIEKHVT